MEENIISGNKLIAEFMWMRLTSEFTNSGINYEWLPEQKHSNWTFQTPPPYHTSWDWLMPVIEKINKLNDDNGDKYFQEWLDLIDNDEPDPLYLLDLKITEPIKNVYKAVIQFITWYNSTQTNINK